MPKFNYVAMDAHGKETKGTLEVASQNEAIGRVKEMGLFPTKIVEIEKVKEKADKKAAPAAGKAAAKKKGGAMNINIKIPGLSGRVKSKVLTTFTRQLATLVDAGLPLLRGLRVLEKQERNPTLKSIIGELALAIEGGSTFSEALAQHPKVFNRLFVNMVKAGELGGVLEVVLQPPLRVHGKGAEDQGQGHRRHVLSRRGARRRHRHSDHPHGQGRSHVQGGLRGHVGRRPFARLHPPGHGHQRRRSKTTSSIPPIGLVVFVILFMLFIRTKFGRHAWDKFKLKMPVVGPVVSKVAISRFTRTLGTLVSSGVPILQALTIVKETAGNVIISNAVSAVHESVKEGETITAPLEASGVFPPMVISMVDVGEQTGALPEMLLKIADNYDEEVDNAVAAMTSLLEPIMIVFLAVIVGSIVIAMFLPLIDLMNRVGESGGGKKGED